MASVRQLVYTNNHLCPLFVLFAANNPKGYLQSASQSPNQHHPDVKMMVALRRVKSRDGLRLLT